MKKITGKQRLRKYAYGGEDPNEPGKRLTAKEIKQKYKSNPFVTGGRETWGESLDATLPLSKVKVRDAIYGAARQTGINPSLLYSSAMEEGLGYAISKPDDASEAYVNWSGKNKKLAQQFPVDGFYNYGLDTFGDQYDSLVKGGYLPADFNTRFTKLPVVNEKGEKYNSAAFMNDQDALIAKAAMIKQTGDVLSKYEKANNLKLTDKQKDFFTLAGYNSGQGNMEKMIKSYQDKGYLKDDKFLNPTFKPASWAGVYTNVQRRLQNRNILDSEGFFSDYSATPPAQQKMATGGEAAGAAATGGGGSGFGMNMLQMLPGIANQVIDLFENDPRRYSKQPTLNADTMHQMVTPYSHFAMGGEIDESTMAQLQAMADEYGITVEELMQQLQDADTGEEEDEMLMEEDEPDDLYGEDNIDQFRMGGKVNRKKKNSIAAQAAKKYRRVYASGGTAIPIEVEDEEVMQMPDGNMVKMKGATHEQRGIDVTVPQGTKIYSDRLQIDGKTMAQRKLAREKTLARLDKLLSKNPQDKLLQGTYNRTMEVIQNEEAQDMNLQKVLNKVYNSVDNVGEFAMGGKVPMYAGGGEPGDDWFYDKTGWHNNNPLFRKSLLEVADQLGQEEAIANMSAGFKDFMTKKQIASKDNTPVGTVYTSDPNSPNFQPEVGSTGTRQVNPGFTGKLSAGDWIGMGGNLFNAIAPLVNTRANAAGNKPNVNRFLGFGKEALDTNEAAQDVVAGLKSSTLTDIDTAANTAKLRNRNSATSVNTIRALDAVTDMGTNKARQSANDSFAKMMTGLFAQRGQLTNLKDQMEMKGEAMRDMEDKADRDNYYSNMAQNLVDFGTNVQGIGKSLNVNKSNKVDAKHLSQLSQYGLGFDDEGNLI
ncbi:MAG: hypothetical protein E6R13_06875 [Spirochaetes bacterium]|nr:MAG: hypothetical protein E6R13_06875 [Spirochaetota bacterium]